MSIYWNICVINYKRKYRYYLIDAVGEDSSDNVFQDNFGRGGGTDIFYRKFSTLFSIYNHIPLPLTLQYKLRMVETFEMLLG
jgi:hypothetical protein